MAAYKLLPNELRAAVLERADCGKEVLRLASTSKKTRALASRRIKECATEAALDVLERYLVTLAFGRPMDQVLPFGIKAAGCGEIDIVPGPGRFDLYVTGEKMCELVEQLWEAEPDGHDKKLGYIWNLYDKSSAKMRTEILFAHLQRHFSNVTIRLGHQSAVFGPPAFHGLKWYAEAFLKADKSYQKDVSEAGRRRGNKEDLAAYWLLMGL